MRLAIEGRCGGVISNQESKSCPARSTEGRVEPTANVAIAVVQEFKAVLQLGAFFDVRSAVVQVSKRQLINAT